MRGRSQSSGALDYRATPGWCRAGEAPRILCGQWGFEIDKGRTPPPIFWHPKMKRNNEVRWLSYCSFLEVVLVARDSCRKNPQALAESLWLSQKAAARFMFHHVRWLQNWRKPYLGLFAELAVLRSSPIPTQWHVGMVGVLDWFALAFQAAMTFI